MRIRRSVLDGAMMQFIGFLVILNKVKDLDVKPVDARIRLRRINDGSVFLTRRRL